MGKNDGKEKDQESNKYIYEPVNGKLDSSIKKHFKRNSECLTFLIDKYTRKCTCWRPKYKDEMGNIEHCNYVCSVK